MFAWEARDVNLHRNWAHTWSKIVQPTVGADPNAKSLSNRPALASAVDKPTTLQLVVPP
jgi:hypothetical protein